MKKYTNIIFALGVVLFMLAIGTKSEVTAKWCYNGGTPIMDTVTVDGCDYEIIVCITCNYAHPSTVYLASHRKIGSCSSSLTPQEVTQGIISQISTYAYAWFDHCQMSAPPCHKKDRLEITFQTPICWKAVCISTSPLEYRYETCYDDAVCETTFSYCTDINGVVQTNELGSVSKNFPPSCILEGWEILPLPTTLGDTTDCYIYHTPCNP